MQIIKNPNLAKYSSIHIGGLGNFLYLPLTTSELLEVLSKLEEYVILGGGTNVVFSDGFAKDVISLQEFCKKEVVIKDNTFIVTAGVKLSRVVYEAVRVGMCGAEVLAGIPGTVGGAVVMNAGSKYGEIGQFVRCVKVYSKRDNDIILLDNSELEFGYRKSNLQCNAGYVVLGVELEFVAGGNSSELQYRATEIIAERITSRIKLPNCGSVFKNPCHELSVGSMVDRLGLKGYRCGGLEVSDHHGNIIVNHGDGSYSDFIKLVGFISQQVKDEFGVNLQLEIKVL